MESTPNPFVPAPAQPITIPAAQAQAVFDAFILALEAKAGPLQKIGLEFLRAEVDGGGLAMILPFLERRGIKVI